jgi:nucleoside-diphosphate-sugar epimerase
MPSIAEGHKLSLLENEADLEDRLSQPTPALIQDLDRMDGDLLILGVAGKMGPSLARMARRAWDAGGHRSRRVIGVARFSEAGSREALEQHGIEAVACDLTSDYALQALPDAKNVVYMAARKFGSTGNEPLTWAINTYLPGKVAERFKASRIVSFSTGNVYPLTPVASAGPTETSPIGPVGEYAQSCLGRERMFQHFSAIHGTPGTILRLNYAVELRYGVLLDIATKVAHGDAIDVTMGYVNVIWQGDANEVALRSLTVCSSPPLVLNLTGAETLSVRRVAERFAELLGRGAPKFVGTEAPTALLSNASKCHGLFGAPGVSVDQVVKWVAHWVGKGGRALNKPTKFQVRDGRF